mgnify:CR=1 FL=1
MTNNKHKTITVNTEKFLNTLNYINTSNLFVNMMWEKAKMYRARIIFYQEVLKGDVHPETTFVDWMNDEYLTKKNVVRKKYQTHIEFEDHSDKEVFMLRESILEEGILDERYIPKDKGIRKINPTEFINND